MTFRKIFKRRTLRINNGESSSKKQAKFNRTKCAFHYFVFDLVVKLKGTTFVDTNNLQFKLRLKTTAHLGRLLRLLNHHRIRRTKRIKNTERNDNNNRR